MDAAHLDPIRQLDEAECLERLRTVDVGRLAISIMNKPDVFPINFVVDGNDIVFRTEEGTKLAASVLGTGVAFEVDGYDAPSGNAWSVVVKGHAAEIDKMEEVLHAEDLPLFPWHAGPKLRFVRIVPDEITGREFRVDPAAIAHTRGH